MGLVDLKHVESFWTRDWTHVLLTGRRILIHDITREVCGSSWSPVSRWRVMLRLFGLRRWCLHRWAQSQKEHNRKGVHWGQQSSWGNLPKHGAQNKESDIEVDFRPQPLTNKSWQRELNGGTSKRSNSKIISKAGERVFFCVCVCHGGGSGGSVSSSVKWV